MKIAFFPYSKMFIDVADIIISRNKSDELFFVGAKGFIKDGDDISNVDNSDVKNVPLYDDIDNIIDICDEIYFVQHDYKKIDENIMFDKCYMALRKKKKVIFTYNFSNEKRELLRKVENEYHNNIIELSSRTLNEKDFNIESNKQLESISIPIIYVGKSTRLVRSDFAFTNLCERLMLTGYRVAAITENVNCSILGYNVIDFSQLIKENDCDTSVLVINRYFKLLESLNKFDVIVLNLSEAATKFSDSNPEGFGVEQFIFSMSAKPDYYIHCMFCEKLEKLDQYLNEISCKFRYKIDAVCMNNISLDAASYSESHRMLLNYHSASKVLEKYNKYFEERNIYYGQSFEDMDRLYSNVIDKLSE